MKKGTAILLSPLSDKVIIHPLTNGRGGKSPSGIIIPESATDKIDRGLVVAVGPGKWNEDGDARTPMSVSVGDTVVFQWGDKIEYDGEEYYIVSESNISAIIQSAK